MAATIVINGTAFDATDCDNVGNVLFEKNCSNNFFKKDMEPTIECEFYYFGEEDVYCKFLMLEELSCPPDVEYDVEKYLDIIRHRSVGTPIPEHFRLWECNVSGIDEDEDQVCGTTTIDLDEVLLPTTERIVILGKIIKRSEEDRYAISSEPLSEVLKESLFELVDIGLDRCRRVCKFTM